MEPRRDIGEGLHVCPECGSGLVQPTAWEQTADRNRWRIWRRCPECEWFCRSVHGEAEIDAYDEQLDRGAHILAEHLRALELESLQLMTDAFVAGLRADLIGADDFAARRRVQL